MKKCFIRFVSFLLSVCIVVSLVAVPVFASSKTEVQPFGGKSRLSSEEKAILKYAGTGFLGLKKDKSVPPVTDGGPWEYQKILKAWAKDAEYSQDDQELALAAQKVLKMGWWGRLDLLKEKVYFPVVEEDGSLAQIEESITVEQAIDSIVYLDVLSEYVSTLDANLEALSQAPPVGKINVTLSDVNFAYSPEVLGQCVDEWIVQIKKQFGETEKIDFPSVCLAMKTFALNKVTDMDFSKFIPRKSKTYETVLTLLDGAWDIAKEVNDYFALIDSYLPDLGFRGDYYEQVFSAAEYLLGKVDESARATYFLGYYYIKDHPDHGALYDMAFDGIVLKEGEQWVDLFTAYMNKTEFPDSIVEAWTQNVDGMRNAGKILGITEGDLQALHYCVNLMRAARSIGKDGLQSYKNGLLKRIGATCLTEEAGKAETAIEATNPGNESSGIYCEFDQDSKTLTIFGTGMMSYTSYNRPWKSVAKEIEKVRIQDGIRSISNHAFLDCTKLTEIEIPNSVTFIGANAFQGCKSLKKITLPDNLLSLDKEVFKGCDNLTELVLPSTLTYYDYAFDKCKSLKRVVLQGGIERIADYAFRDCVNLTEIEIPGSVTAIGNHAFEGCKSLKKITLPDNLTYIGSYAFQGCSFEN